MKGNRMLRRLGDADDAIALSKQAIAIATEQLDMVLAGFRWLDADAAPVLMIDNVPSSYCDDADRLAWLTRAVLHADPQHEAMFRTHCAVGVDVFGGIDRLKAMTDAYGYRGPIMIPTLLPIIEPGGLLATMRVGRPTPPTRALERDLDALATFISVHCARLALVARPATPVALTGRQLAIAQLAARGDTNVEIADTLQISPNTVKKHLKDAFVRLDITRRNELGALLARAPFGAIPAGIVTHHRAIAIARAR